VRRHPALTRLLAVLLLVQWGTAFSHCLQLALRGPAPAIEICSAEGIHHLVLPPGEEGPRHGKALATALCPACQSPAAVAMPAPTVAPTEPVALVLPADPPPPAPAPAPAPSPSNGPRAPPAA
jgi:hypothetical protein